MTATTVRLDLRTLTKGLDSVARKQLPFAAAMALNVVAKQGFVAERAAMTADLDRPRSFTTNQGLRLVSASKSSPIATIFIPPIQSGYLRGEIAGGLQTL